MVEKFVQLKKKAVIKALLYALLVGVSFAALLFGGLFAFSKLTDKSLSWLWYLLSWLGGLLLVGGGVLLFTYPTTKRFAKYLDETYSLGERVRTAVEFSGKEGVVLDLQRGQTQEVLSTLPKKKKTLWWAVKIFLLPLLAAATVTTAIVLPKKEEPAPPPYEEPVYETTLYNVKDLEALIANIKGSALPDEMKTTYLTGLNALLALIQTEAPTQKEVLASVNGLMQLIIDVTREGNGYNAVVAAAKAPALAPMVTALKESGVAYQSLEGVSLYSYATLTNREEGLLQATTAAWKKYIDTLSAEISRLGAEEYARYATEYVALLDEVLAEEKVAAMAQEDGLKGALSAVREGLYKATQRLATPDAGGETYGGKSFSTIKAETALAMEKTYNVNEINAVEVLGKQAYAVMIKDYTLHTLSNIFSVSIPQEGEEEVGNEGTGGSGGGGGGGNMEYPDDGLVLDPTDGQYKPYGLLLADYYKKVTELMEGDEEISEELKAYIKAYFEGLQTKEN